MSSTEVTAPTGQPLQGEQDLGPLAWVLEELRKSLDSAVKATRRFVREAEAVRDSDLAALDSSPLRMAKQQLHQSSGALEMVGMPQAALLLRAMESAVQHYVQNPADCSEAVAHTLEKASFALLEFLDAVLAGQRISAVALFPQYRDVQALYGHENKVHPADLWPIERRLRDPEIPSSVPLAALNYGTEPRKVLDAAVLQIVKGIEAAAASARMRDVCLGYAQAQTEKPMRIFWKVAGGYFDAMAHSLLPADIYTKRMASRVLMVSVALAKGDPVAPERLLQDMLFFCAQAASDAKAAPEAVVWKAVYNSFGLQRHLAVNYQQARFGRFDPALLAQARKRIGAATDIWSALAGGDTKKIKPAFDQFTLVIDSLSKLHPDSQPLGHALMQVMQSVVSRGQPPTTEVAMEVATAVLYLQAAFASLDLSDDAMAAHGLTLAHRLHAVLAGAPAQPLEPWMEQLYRKVSDQQTMGSVVGELRVTLAETEKLLDQYFRNPADTTVLGPVAAYLLQMRGVLSVLGLDQASLAMARMRQNVDRLMVGDMAEAEQQLLFEKIGNSLGALGFLIDMLSYQRNMARKLYEFDEAEGELKLTMGRVRVRASDAGGKPVEEVLQARVEQIVQPVILPRPMVVEVPTSAVPAQVDPIKSEQSTDVQSDVLPEREMPPAMAPAIAENLVSSPAPIALDIAPEDTDSELLGIFLEEAREVVAQGRAALQVLSSDPANLSEQTVLRRAFHTLKGSSRMVGLDEFGQAGWAMEQMLNAWLAEQKAMPVPMQQLALQALHGLEAWANAIETQSAHEWQCAPFRASADAMRLESRLIELDMAAVQAGRSGQAPVAALDTTPMLAADSSTLQDRMLGGMPPAVVAEIGEPAQDAETQLSTSIPVDAATEALHNAHDGDQVHPQKVAPALISLDEAQVPAALDIAQEISFDEFDALLAAMDQEGSEDKGLPADMTGLSFVEAMHVDEAAPNEAPELVGAQPDAMNLAETGAESHCLDAGAVDALRADMDVPEAGGAVQQIGNLSVPLPLFNVYLSEAKGWAYRLLDALTAWSENLEEAQPEMVSAWAHALAGSSATIGFAALSDLARKLEHTFVHVQPQVCGRADQVQCFVHAAQAIQSMLSQVAAGMLPSGNVDVLLQLQSILDGEVDAALTVAAPLQPQSGDTGDLAYLTQPADTLQDRIDAAISRVMTFDDEQDDDIEVFNAIDTDLFPIFEEEAMELLPSLGAAMREWAMHPTRLEARASLLRALHTLKGSARLAGALRIGAMAHRLESALEALDAATVTSEQIEPLFVRLDAMEADFNALRVVGLTQSAPTHLTSSNAPESNVAPDVAFVAEAVDHITTEQVPDQSGLTDLNFASHPIAEVHQPAVMRGERQAAQQSVRVRSQLLDRLVNEAGEVMMARSRLDERVGSIKHSLADLNINLEKLRNQLRDIEVQAESQMQSRMQLSKEAGTDFDPLEFDRFTRVQELTRMMAESVNDVATVQRNLQHDVAAAEDDLIAQGRQARELQRDLLRTRMVEFDSISERLYAVVRRTSKETGKQVKLDLSGGTIEMDRGVLERIVPAFEHLLRNCVDHGVELPQERQALGKPAAGAINVRVQQEGNDVAVTFEDDGAGLNVARIREKALALGLISAEEPVDAARAAQLVFMPGFTTAQQLTGVSGRGIGMDVVRSEVQALGGRIETHSEPGAGSCFRLILPLTTAVTQVVMLRAGDFSVGVPASLVEVVRRVSLSDLEAAYRQGALVEGEEQIPFYWAGAVWSHSPRSLDLGAGKTRQVIIFRSASQRIALHVDEVLGHQEVVVKNLGPQMSRLPGLTGMSVLASGAVVLIYNPVALTTVYGAQIAQMGQGLPAFLGGQDAKQAQGSDAAVTAGGAGVASSHMPLVMVVDDSITVRRVSQRLLQREGYRVVTAADGLQALEKLQDEVPSVVLSDIEMPRMDGFDLLRNIRSQMQLGQLPVIMITSRMAQKHRHHAMELGANHYLGKPYSDEELMRLVHHYAAGQALPAVHPSRQEDVQSTA